MDHKDTNQAWKAVRSTGRFAPYRAHLPRLNALSEKDNTLEQKDFDAQVADAVGRA